MKTDPPAGGFVLIFILLFMWKFLEKLRALPEDARKAIVLFSSMGITALILTSWLVFPVPHFGALSQEDQERKSAENLTAPFSIIGGEIQESVGGIKNKWDSLGGTAGILSAVSALKEKVAENTASSTTATTTPAEEYFNEIFASSTTEIFNEATTTQASSTEAAEATETFTISQPL